MSGDLHVIYLQDQGHAISLPKNSETFYANSASVKIWIDDEIKNFLSANYGNELLNAYLSLRAYAAKADLARAAIINMYGGFYSDINNTLLTRLDKIVQDKSFIAFRDRNHNTLVSWSVQNSFFYSQANHPILEKYLELILGNVANRYYGLTPLSSTATSVFGRAFALVGEIDSVQFGDFVSHNRISYFQLPDGELIARFKDSSLRGGESNIPGGNNYNEIWRERNFYNENKC